MEMEPIGAYFDEECESSLSRIFSSGEADHFMAQLYGANYEYGNTFSNNGFTSSNFLSIDETNVNISETESAIFNNLADSFHTNFHHFSKENSYSSGSNTPFFPTQSNENYQVFCDSNQMQVMNKSSQLSTNISSDEFLVPSFPHRDMEEFLFMTTEMVNEKSENEFNQASNVADLGKELKLKRMMDVQEHEASGDEKKNYITELPKKKPRLPIDAQKGKRNAMSKKSNKNISLNGTDENNVTIDTQNHSSSCSSEDDNCNITSEDCKGEVNAALNSSGKTRARRGAATDPQSLYARRRREKINGRLRILQNLVPNGTKVDISTMLEEAVHYVKFLQLQIRLLSSDELWMFAPIAYNGMDMGLYQKISI